MQPDCDHVWRAAHALCKSAFVAPPITPPLSRRTCVLPSGRQQSRTAASAQPLAGAARLLPHPLHTHGGCISRKPTNQVLTQLPHSTRQLPMNAVLCMQILAACTASLPLCRNLTMLEQSRRRAGQAVDRYCTTRGAFSVKTLLDVFQPLERAIGLKLAAWCKLKHCQEIAQRSTRTVLLPGSAAWAQRACTPRCPSGCSTVLNHNGASPC
jgi:hypothetical protein